MISLSFEWLSRDGKLLLAARIARTFAYGFLRVILSIYLKLIGYNELLIGMVIRLPDGKIAYTQSWGCFEDGIKVQNKRLDLLVIVRRLYGNRRTQRPSS